jgi:hypothetical protein
VSTTSPTPSRAIGGRIILAILAIPIVASAIGIWWATRTKTTDVVNGHVPKNGVAPDNPELDGPTMFEDVAATSGVTFTYRNGEEANRYTILESLGGGVALFDYDGDGKVDIFFTGGGSFTVHEPPRILGAASKLYRNLGQWRVADVTAAAGLDGPLFYTHGAAAADYDCDGFTDLLVTGWDRVALYHNEPDGKGGRRFVEMSAKAGLTDTRWSSSAAWGDLDGDGFPDLYICYYVDWSFANDPHCPGSQNQPRDVCPPQRFGPLRHRLYRNEAGKSFRDITAEAGLRPDGKGLGVVMVDVNADGKPDIYVGNDAGDNFLYLNQGGMRFEEKGQVAGVAVDDNGVYNGSMGVDAADYDRTGRPSIWVTNFQGEYHALYRNLGSGRFRHSSQAAGIGRLGQQSVGFGTGFFDFDNDSWEDLVVANGHVLRYPVGSTFLQRPFLLRNEELEGRRQFRRLAGLGGPYFRQEHGGRGLAIGDLDDNGWPDLVVSHQNSPVAVLRNVSHSTIGAGNHWIGIKLKGMESRDLVGTTLTLEANGERQTRFVKGGGSYLSTNDVRVQFGLAHSTEPGPLTIRWGGGRTQQFELPEIDCYWEIVEEGERAQRLQK